MGEDGFMKGTTAIVVIIFVVTLATLVGSLAWSAYLNVKCLDSNDPHSTACYLRGTPVEIGVTQR